MSVTKKELRTGQLPDNITRDDIYELARKGQLRRFFENSFGEQNKALVDRVLAADGPNRPAMQASRFAKQF